MLLLKQLNALDVVVPIQIYASFHLPTFDTMAASRDYLEWVRLLTASGSKMEKRTKLGILFLFWWQIRTERNNKVFQEDEHSANRVAVLIKDQVQTLPLARDRSFASFR
jgi:hypothetical protein